MRRQEQKARTRSALKQAALHCLVGENGHACPVAQIARQAGVATGTFYVHFASKDALVDELLADFNADFSARLLAAWPGQADALRDPEGLIARLAGTCLDFWLESRSLLEVFSRHAAARGDLTALREGISPPVAEFLCVGLEALAAVLGQPLEHSRLLVQGLLGMWTRIGLQYLFAEQVTREAALACLCRLSLGAVRGILPGLPPTSEGVSHAR